MFPNRINGNYNSVGVNNSDREIFARGFHTQSIDEHFRRMFPEMLLDHSLEMS